MKNLSVPVKAFTSLPARCLLALAGSLFCSPVLGNDGWWTATSNAESFGKRHPTIQMVTEDLNIEYGDSKVWVTIDYYFKNHGKATTVTMAFPENFDKGSQGGSSWIRSSVDGKGVKLTKKLIDKATEDKSGYLVYLKTLRFGAQQGRKVRVQYQTYLGGNTSGNLGLTYILRSGASWYKPIERCTITIDWSRAKTVSHPEIMLNGVSPAWKAVSQKKRRAVLRNFVPKTDLQLDMVDWFWTFQINGKKVPFNVVGFNPPPIAGSPKDPFISIESVDSFLSSAFVKRKKGDSWGTWHDTIVAYSGEKYEVKGSYVVSESGKKVALPRKPRMLKPKGFGERQGYVYLRDVVKAIGGKCRYENGVFKIDFPKASAKNKAVIN